MTNKQLGRWIFNFRFTFCLFIYIKIICFCFFLLLLLFTASTVIMSILYRVAVFIFHFWICGYDSFLLSLHNGRAWKNLSVQATRREKYQSFWTYLVFISFASRNQNCVFGEKIMIFLWYFETFNGFYYKTSFQKMCFQIFHMFSGIYFRNDCFKDRILSKKKQLFQIFFLFNFFFRF